MSNRSEVWEFIAHSLDNKQPVMLLYVLESKGSSPGRQGFFMAVNINGEMEGTIGGGIMEHKWVEAAKEKMAQKKNTGTVLRKQVHDKSAADQSGMICSGEQTILLYFVNESDRQIIEELLVSLDKNENGTLILSPAGIQFLKEPAVVDFSFEQRSAEDWEYREKTGYRKLLTIVGGGHCALALSILMHRMGFYIRVYDDRTGLNTLRKNTFAHEVIVINSYAVIGERVIPGDDHYVVIMTTGYRTDDLVMRALAGKKFKFLGLLGSKTKVEKMMAMYRKEGIDPGWLDRVEAPVGIPINSQTVEEIAVSIAASLIKAASY
jgi:xanthine dehydrogenase accessory factor